MKTTLTNNQLITIRTIAEAGGSIVMKGSNLDQRTLTSLCRKGLVRSTGVAGTDWTCHLTADGWEAVGIVRVKPAEEPCETCQGVGGWMADSDGNFVCGSRCEECGKVAPNAEAVEPTLTDECIAAGTDWAPTDPVKLAAEIKSMSLGYDPAHPVGMNWTIETIENGCRKVVLSGGEEMRFYTKEIARKVFDRLTDDQTVGYIALCFRGKVTRDWMPEEGSGEEVCSKCLGTGYYTLPCAGSLLFLCDHDPNEAYLHRLAPNDVQPTGLGIFAVTIPAEEKSPTQPD